MLMLIITRVIVAVIMYVAIACFVYGLLETMFKTGYVMPHDINFWFFGNFFFGPAIDAIIAKVSLRFIGSIFWPVLPIVWIIDAVASPITWGIRWFILFFRKLGNEVEKKQARI